jgi:phosphorylcholine metabolism protein LicD
MDVDELTKQATQNLTDFKQIADQEKMRFMLMEGNLLGAYRDGGFTEGDEDDIDVGIMDDQFLKLDDVVYGLSQLGFECKKLVVHRGLWHGGCWERNGNHIDIMRMLNDGKVYNIGEMGHLRYDYSPDIFEEYGKINFLGLELETVGKIEKFLEERYGDWKTKVPRQIYSYSNPIFSPNVKRL